MEKTMKRCKKYLRPGLLRLIVAALVCGCLVFSLPASRSIRAEREGENPAVCETAGTKFKVGQQFAVGRLPRTVVAGDFNNDGFADLAVANLTPNSERQIAILLGNGRGEFARIGNLRPGPNDGSGIITTNTFVVGDLNGDRRQDIVCASESGGVALFLSKGDGTFAAPVNLVAGSQPSAVVIADFDGDNKNDIAASGRTGTVWILRGNGDGTFAQSTSINVSTTTQTLGSADFNNDGKPDLVIFAASASAT